MVFTPLQWHQATSLFEATLQQVPEARLRFLEDNCSHPEIRKEVLRLVINYDEMGSFLSTDGLSPFPSDRLSASSDLFQPNGSNKGVTCEVAGDSIGPYRLEERIGEGGMGTVWLAQQKHPIQRRAAIKLIRSGLHSQELLARFQSERQALALMDHPAIAKVFDGGSTPQGRPFFAMEFVQGVQITAYCDQHRLSVAERLSLFIRVCEGVQHAHQRAIIHRDLKPSNILVAEVDGQPSPKIIDFGVSKAALQQSSEGVVLTSAQSIIGTPEYMSPEQASSGGTDVDIRTDIYSLGVILFELLSGQRPFDFAHMQWHQILGKIQASAAPKPSSRVRALGDNCVTAAKNCGTNKRTLIRQLSGDLDSITSKALEKDRSRRYDSAVTLATDIKRHLDNEPISAHPPAIMYRARKFITRHRLASVIAGAALIVLTSFVINRMVELHRISRERDRADRITKFMTSMFKISNPGESRGREVTVREILDKASGDISSGLSRDPELQAQLMELMGGVYYNLGLYTRAQTLFSRALPIRTRVLGLEHRDTLELMDTVAFLMMTNGQLAQAEHLQRKIVETDRRVLGPKDTYTLVAQDTLGSILYSEGRYRESAEILSEAVTLKAKVFGADSPITLVSLDNLANAFDGQHRYAEAEKLHRHAADVRRRTLGPENPETLRLESNLASSLIHLGRYGEAEELLRSVRASQLKILGPDHRNAAESTYGLASIAALRGDTANAVSLLREAVDHGLGQKEAIDIGSDPDFRSLHGDRRFSDLLAHIAAKTF